LPVSVLCGVVTLAELFCVAAVTEAVGAAVSSV
jgi:hypothetical protein